MGRFATEIETAYCNLLNLICIKILKTDDVIL